MGLSSAFQWLPSFVIKIPALLKCFIWSASCTHFFFFFFNYDFGSSWALDSLHSKCFHHSGCCQHLFVYLLHKWHIGSLTCSSFMIFGSFLLLTDDINGPAPSLKSCNSYLLFHDKLLKKTSVLKQQLFIVSHSFCASGTSRVSAGWFWIRVSRDCN